MFRLILTVLAIGALPGFAGHSGSPVVESSDNVNCRYTVERVELTGYQARSVSKSIRQRLDGMIGRNLDSLALDRIASRIRQELKVDEVHIRIGKGTRPQQVAVQLEIRHEKKAVDFNLTRAGFQSVEGWSGAAGLSMDFAGNRAGLSYMSDADPLIERSTGFVGTFERSRLTRDSRVGFRIGYGALNETWNQQTLAAFAGDPKALRYGFRQYVEPELTVQVTRDLQFSVGMSAEQLGRVQTAAGASAPNEASNALIETVRYRNHFEGSENITHDLDAAYFLRAGTRALGSDFVYTRHSANVTYALKHLGHTVRLVWTAGLVNGVAPLYERFALGNSNTLRGWNKYALAPLGGERIVHGTVEYRYRMFEAFYDVGAIWDRTPAPLSDPKTARDPKHSIGVGIRKDAIQLAVAFPLRNGRMDPVFLAGVNF